MILIKLSMTLMSLLIKWQLDINLGANSLSSWDLGSQILSAMIFNRVHCLAKKARVVYVHQVIDDQYLLNRAMIDFFHLFVALFC